MTGSKLTSRLTLAVLSLAVFTMPAALESQGARSRVIIRTPKPYTNVESVIAQSGGRVTHRFRKIDLIAAELTESGLRQLRSRLPAGAISKDEIVPAPEPIRDLADRGTGQASVDYSGEVTGFDVAGLQDLGTNHPAAYLVNNAITGVSVLHGAGIAGQGITVAVIDSGIRPGFPHLTTDGSVVGCEDFVLDANGCSNNLNEGHGTFVAGMISANANFVFNPASALRNAVLAYAPGAFSNTPPTVPPNIRIPMVGSAPLASIYALRVFGVTGGAPTSRILQAIERAIELRELFDAGTPGGADIQVVNMSLGGSTIYAGRDLFDRMVNTLLEADIVPVIAASNNGPALVTTGSPGSAFSALTVGAASFAHNERILRDLQFGPGIGGLYRLFNGTQTAFFSSRGPNADGRPDPDVMATGFANYGMGTGPLGSISIGSGTSYSSPSVAGVAALLRQAFPTASALKIRNAIIAGANDAIISDGSSQYDEGQGMVDAVASFNLLDANQVPLSFFKPFKWWWLFWWHPFTQNVAINLELAGLDVQRGHVSENSGLLLPGQHHSILYNVKPGTASVTIQVSNFQQTGPGNVLFGDDIILAVHSAKTSAIGAEGDYPFFNFTVGGTFVVNDPEPGIMRITLYGDWTNSGTVSVDADVTSVMEGLPKLSARGDVRNGETDTFSLNVPAGTASLEFLLRWEDDWSRYPGADLDLILTSPTSAVNVNGATLNSPERVTIANPAAGTWTIDVDGFEIHRNKEQYKVTAILDGQVVKLK